MKKKKKKTKFIDKIGPIIVLIFLMVLVIMGVLELFKLRITTVSCDSWSMYPTSYCGCFHLEGPIRYTGQIKEKDIIIYRYTKNGRIINIMHRVKEWHEDHLITEGDFNGRTDPIVLFNQVKSKLIGKFCFFQPEQFEEEAFAWRIEHMGS